MHSDGFYSYRALRSIKNAALRSMEALNNRPCASCVCLETGTSHVNTTVGPEQEYFLVDREQYRRREDLIPLRTYAVRRKAAEGQELEDHYFGSIKPRVTAFMEELYEEL